MSGVIESFEKILALTWAVSIIRLLIIIISMIVLNKIVKSLFNRKIMQRIPDKTHLTFMKHLIKGLIYFSGITAAILQIPGFESASVSIIASSGVFALVIGFASQQAFSNIISGLFISIFKPFRIGDMISFIAKNTSGVVEDITLRHIIVRTFENKRVIIPNSLINTEIIENSNLVDEKICRFVDFDISYDSSIDNAMHIIREEIINHRHFIDNRTEQLILDGADPVPVKVIGFSDSSVKLRGWAWTKDARSAFELGCDLNKSIKERFDKEGVVIPYPHRTVIYKNSPENL